MNSSEVSSSEAVNLDAIQRPEDDDTSKALQPIGLALGKLLSAEEAPCARSLPPEKISLEISKEAEKVENASLPTLGLAVQPEAPSSKLPEEEIAVEANTDPANLDLAKKEEVTEAPSSKLPEEEIAVEANTDPANLVSLPEDPAQEPPAIFPFPNLGKEAIQVGLGYEQQGSVQLVRYEETVNNHLDTIDELLKLNAELAKQPEGKPLSEEINQIFAGLKEKGIDFGNLDKISKEKKAELKSSANAFIDQNRTRIQQVYTKIQTTVQNMQSVTETMKRILQSLERLQATLTRNQRPGA